jgi:hypothetical protein
VTFYTQASINLADDPELVTGMVRAGFDTVFVGIETPDEAGLAEANKKHNAGRDLIDDVKRLLTYLPQHCGASPPSVGSSRIVRTAGERYTSRHRGPDGKTPSDSPGSSVARTGPR